MTEVGSRLKVHPITTEHRINTQTISKVARLQLNFQYRLSDWRNQGRGRKSKAWRECKSNHIVCTIPSGKMANREGTQQSTDIQSVCITKFECELIFVD